MSARAETAKLYPIAVGWSPMWLEHAGDDSGESRPRPSIRYCTHAHVIITQGQDSYRLAQATAGKGMTPLT